MITMINGKEGCIPSFAAPEVLQDMDGVKDLRYALFEMLEIVLSDEDYKFVTPSNSLYIVASLIRELSRDIEKSLQEEGGES